MIDAIALFATRTAAQFLSAVLDMATIAGLPVTSWRTGDPTLTTFEHTCEMQAQAEQIHASYAKSGFLSTAEDDWAEVHAREVYGVERDPSSPATPTVTITNTGGAVHEIAAGDLTVKCSATGATFHNTEAWTFTGIGTADATHTLALVADVEGSAGTVAADEIDEFVTTYTGLEITGSTAAVGTDQQSIDALKEDCGDTLGALSPNGPPDAYEYVVRNSALTGVSTITRSRSSDDSDTGDVTVYVAGPSGAVDGPSVVAAQAAIIQWANPLCMTPTAVSATTVAVPVTATVTGDAVPANIEALVSAKLVQHFGRLPIAGVGGETIYRSKIYDAIHDAAELDGVTLTLPASDGVYAEGFVPVLGTLIVTVA